MRWPPFTVACSFTYPESVIQQAPAASRQPLQLCFSLLPESCWTPDGEARLAIPWPRERNEVETVGSTSGSIFRGFFARSFCGWSHSLGGQRAQRRGIASLLIDRSGFLLPFFLWSGNGRPLSAKKKLILDEGLAAQICKWNSLIENLGSLVVFL